MWKINSQSESLLTSSLANRSIFLQLPISQLRTNQRDISRATTLNTMETKKRKNSVDSTPEEGQRSRSNSSGDEDSSPRHQRKAWRVQRSRSMHHPRRSSPIVEGTTTISPPSSGDGGRFRFRSPSPPPRRYTAGDVSPPLPRVHRPQSASPNGREDEEDRRVRELNRKRSQSMYRPPRTTHSSKPPTNKRRTYITYDRSPSPQYRRRTFSMAPPRRRFESPPPRPRSRSR